MKRRLILGALWALSLVVVAAGTAAAQRTSQSPLEPEVISGDQIGFRVDRYNGATPVGELVVRRNGKWVAVEFGARLKVMR